MPRREPTVERMSVCAVSVVCAHQILNMPTTIGYAGAANSKNNANVELGPGQRSGDPFGHPTQSTDSAMSCHLITHSMNIDKGWRGKVLERTHGLSDCLPVCLSVSPSVSTHTDGKRVLHIRTYIYTPSTYVILGLTQAPSLTPICAPSPFTPHALLLRHQQQNSKKVSLIYSWKNLQRLETEKEQLELKSNWGP